MHNSPFVFVYGQYYVGVDHVEDNLFALHQAADEGNVDLVRLLFERGYDINMLNKYAQTPLHCAAKSSRFAALGLLLDLGADSILKDSQGNIPKDLLSTSDQTKFDDLISNLYLHNVRILSSTIFQAKIFPEPIGNIIALYIGGSGKKLEYKSCITTTCDEDTFIKRLKSNFKKIFIQR